MLELLAQVDCGCKEVLLVSLPVVQLSRSNNSKRSGAGVALLEAVIQVVRLSVQQHAKVVLTLVKRLM